MLNSKQSIPNPNIPQDTFPKQKTQNLEKAINLSSLDVNVDIKVSRRGRKTRDGLDIRSLGVEVARTRRHLDVPDGNSEARWGALEGGVVGKRVLSLCNADGKVSKALAGVGGNLLGSKGRELDAGGTVHLGGDGSELLLDRHLGSVEELKVLGLVGSLHDTLGEVDGSESSLGPVVGWDGVLGTSLDGLLADGSNFGRSVSLEAVDGDDDGDTKGLGVGNVLGQVDAAGADEVDVLGAVLGSERSTGGDVGTSTVNLQSTNSGDNDNAVGDKAGRTALDVEETLTAHGEIETGLGDDVASLGVILVLLGTGKLESEAVGNDRGSANGNVGKGSGVDKDGSTLKGLHKVGLDGILHEGSEGTANSDIVAGNGVTLLGGGNNHAAETLTHVGKVVGEGEDGHTLGGDGNIKTSHPLVALLGGSETNLNLTEMAVVDVEDTLPGNGVGVDIKTSKAADLLLSQVIRVGLVNPELLEATKHNLLKLALALLVLGDETVKERTVLLGGLVEHAGIESSGEEVVGGGNGVDITSQVHVELVHGDNLRVASTGGTTLDAKGGALGRLADVGKGNLAEVGTESLGETHGGGLYKSTAAQIFGGVYIPTCPHQEA